MQVLFPPATLDLGKRLKRDREWVFEVCYSVAFLRREFRRRLHLPGQMERGTYPSDPTALALDTDVFWDLVAFFPTGNLLCHCHSLGSYSGDFKDGVRDGQGTFRWADGREYIGAYKLDLRHGQGKMKYAGELPCSGILLPPCDGVPDTHVVYGNGRRGCV